MCSNWDSLCIEHALQHTSLDWCSSDRIQYIDPLSITAIWGSFLYSLQSSSSWLPDIFLWFEPEQINGWHYIFFVVKQIRKLEFFIAFLVFTIAACFMVELGYAKPVAKEVVTGLFVPKLQGHGATGLAISLLGAMVMPWVPHVFCSHFFFCPLICNVI